MYDRYFTSLLAIQRALDVADARRAARLAELAEALELPRSADLHAVADALHTRLEQRRVARGRINVDAGPDFQAALERWSQSVSDAPDPRASQDLERLERAVDARVTFDGGEQTGLEPVVTAIARLARRALALERAMELLPLVSAELQRTAPRPEPTTPDAWRREFQSAELYLASVRGRAAAQEAESRRTMDLLRAAVEPGR